MLIADINLRPEAQTFVKSVAEKPGPIVTFHRTDVTDWTQLEAAFNEAEKTFGTVPDLVCPGAGIYEPVNFGCPFNSCLIA